MMQKLFKSNWTPSLVALGMTAIVSGCAAPLGTMTHPETTLMVGLSRDSDATVQNKTPKEINGVIASQSNLRSSLEALRQSPSPPPAKLKDLIGKVRIENSQTPGGLKSFGGLGGGYTHALLSGAKGKVGLNGDFDLNQASTVTLSGLITGYTYNPGNNSGTLDVETTAVTTVGGVETKRRHYVYEIEIHPNGFEVFDHSGNDDDPFPGTLVFDQPMLDRIKDKGFNKKLYVDRGGKIKIESITISVNNGPPHSVPPGDPLLRSDPDDCIDIMFKVPPGGSVPTNYSQLQEHSYCLGRCRRPAIINTK